MSVLQRGVHGNGRTSATQEITLSQLYDIGKAQADRRIGEIISGSFWEDRHISRPTTTERTLDETITNVFKPYRYAEKENMATAKNRVKGNGVARTKSKVPKKPDLITTALRAIRVAYANDDVAPGLVLSMLKEGEWYASICRYNGPHKIVMYKAKSISIESSIKIVMNQFLNTAAIFDTLRRAL